MSSPDKDPSVEAARVEPAFGSVPMEWLDAGIVPFQDVDKLDALSVYQLADRDLAAEVTDKDVLVFFVVIDRGAVNIRPRLL